MDLNTLNTFAQVALHRSFSGAARALGMPKSSVSRAVTSLESSLGLRLLQRTTRAVVLTEAGVAFNERCAEILERIGDTVDYMGGFTGAPRGALRLSAGYGFGVGVLADLLPRFMELYPEVDLSVDLTSRNLDLVASNVDVAVRMGPLSDSALIATKLGSIRRVIVASPGYLKRRGTPKTPAQLAGHAVFDMRASDGRPRTWELADVKNQTTIVPITPRVAVNDVITMLRLALNGAGIAAVAHYLCVDDIARGRLVTLFPKHSLPRVDVHLVFPSKRELSPTVRAFVDFMKDASTGAPWRS